VNQENLIAERFQAYANQLREMAFVEWWMEFGDGLPGKPKARCSIFAWKMCHVQHWWENNWKKCGLDSWNSPIQGGVQNF
jgi:hypothetical protein